MGRTGRVLGGQSREFLSIGVKEIKDTMLDEEINCVASDARIADHFFPGISLVFLKNF